MKHSVEVRVFLILLAVVVVGVSVFVIINRNGEGEVYTTDDRVRVTSVVSETNRDILADPDNDGLANWEEILWGTDKFNDDTDGDGTDDGIEVAEKRNPTQAENDQLVTEPATETSATKQLSIDLFSQYLIARDSGADVVGPVSDDIVGSVLTSDYLSLPVEKHEADILLIDTNISLEEYANTIGLLLLATSGQIGVDESEASILEQYQQTENASVLAELAGPFDRYTKLRDALLATETPPETAVVHLAMLNSIERIRSGLLGIQQLNEDSILGIVGLSVYKDGSLNMINTLEYAQNIYTENGIFFEEGQAGYVFLYGL